MCFCSGETPATAFPRITGRRNLHDCNALSVHDLHLQQNAPQSPLINRDSNIAFGGTILQSNWRASEPDITRAERTQVSVYGMSFIGTLLICFCFQATATDT